MTDLDILYEEVFGEEEIREEASMFYEKAVKKKDIKEAEAAAHVFTINSVCNILISVLADMKKKEVAMDSIPENSREKIGDIRDSARSMIRSEKYSMVKTKMLYKKLDTYYKPIYNVAKKNKIKMASLAIGGDLVKRNIASTDQIMKMTHDQFVKQQQRSQEAVDKALDLF